MVLRAGKIVRRIISCPEPPRTNRVLQPAGQSCLLRSKTPHEGCECYSSPDTGERYDPDKKSQHTLVNFVDNRRFLCYNKPATWKKVFFLCLKLLKYEQQKQGRNEKAAADPQGSQAITQIHSGGGSRARKNHIGMY